MEMFLETHLNMYHYADSILEKDMKIRAVTMLKVVLTY